MTEVVSSLVAWAGFEMVEIVRYSFTRDTDRRIAASIISQLCRAADSSTGTILIDDVAAACKVSVQDVHAVAKRLQEVNVVDVDYSQQLSLHRPVLRNAFANANVQAFIDSAAQE